MASAAFTAWRATDRARGETSRFDLRVPVDVDNTVDYEARAHELGIHLFPSTNWPIIICIGLLLLGVAAVPIVPVARIVLGVMGGVIFLAGVTGWVLIEDVKMYPAENMVSGEAHR